MTTMKYCLRLALLMLCLTALPASATTRASNTAGQDHPAPLAMDQGNLEVVGHLSSVVTSVAVQGNYAYIGGGYEFAVLALDNPARPQRLGYVLLSAPIQAIAVAGTHAYILIGPDVLGVVDVAFPTAPKLVGRVDVPGSPQLTGLAPDIAVVGDYIYVSGETGLHLFDRSNPVAPVAVGRYAPANVVLSDLDVAGHYVYVAGSGSGGTTGIRIVDVSNPAAPVEVGMYIRDGVLMPHVVVRGTYAYVGSSKGLRIVDVSNPAAPTEVSVTTLPGRTPFAGYSLVIVENYAYLAMEWVFDPSLYVVDISNPAAPRAMEPIVLPTPGDSVPIEMASNGQSVYLALHNRGLVAYNISAPSAPVGAGSYRVPGLVIDMAVRNQHVYTVGANLRIVDISDPAAPAVVATYEPPQGVSYTKIVLTDRYAYLGGFRFTTLSATHFTIVDALNPETPVGSLPLPDLSVRDLVVVGNYAYVLTEESLHIVHVSNPAAPAVAGTYRRPSNAATFYSIAVADGYAYISSSPSSETLRVVDVRNPAATQQVGVLNVGGDLDIAGRHLYVAGGHCPTFIPCTGKLNIVDVATPQSPAIIGQLEGSFNQVTVDGPYAYLTSTDPERHVQVADVSNPRSPRVLGFYDAPGDETLLNVRPTANLIVFTSQVELSTLRYNELTVAGQFTHANRTPAPVSGIRLASDAGNTAQSGTGGSYSLSRMPLGTHTITPTLDGYTFWPPTRTVTLPPSARGQDFVILPGPVSTTLTAEAAATLAFTDTQGLRTQLDIPAGVVSETTTLIVTPTMAVDGPRMVFAGHAFELLALRGGAPVPDFSFNLPMTVTLRYSGADVRFVSDKRQVGLWWWNGNGWEQSSELCVSALPPTHDQANKILRVPVCRTGRLALLGPTHRIHLPTIAHAAPSS